MKKKVRELSIPCTAISRHWARSRRAGAHRGMLTLGSFCLLPQHRVSPLPRHLLALGMTIPSTPLADFIREQQVDATLVSTPASAPTDTVLESAASLGLTDAALIVKSIVFVAANGIPLLVLAPGTLRIDRRALERQMGCRVRLATPAEAEAATGHVVGTIPPLCVDACSTLEVFMDRAVYEQTESIYAGTGVQSLHLCIPPAELLRVSGATVGDFTLEQPPEASAPMPAELPDDNVVLEETSFEDVAVPPPRPSPPPIDNAALKEIAFEYLLVPGSSADDMGSDERPGGPDAPPLPREVARVLAAKSLSPTPIELPRAEVLRVRRQAKELVFATLRALEPPRSIVPASNGDADWQQSGDVAPDDGCWYGKGGKDDSGEVIVWKSRLEEAADDAADVDSVHRRRRPTPSPLPPVLSADATWQLIVGKTLHGRLGSKAARKLTRALKPGAVISATGRAQLNPRLTGPDLVARSLEILETESPALDAKRETAAPKPAAPVPRSPPPPSPTGTQTTAARAPLPASPCLLVDDASSLEQLSTGMDAAISNSEPIGIDAEWRPRSLSSPEDEAETPLALLQIATPTRTFVIDMIAISSDPALALSLQSIVRRVMRAPTVSKLGFAMQEDLRRVEAALPGATEGAEALFDLQDGATRALGFPKRKVVGLAASCESLLSMVVDKTEQTSDWSARPLTASQLAYAATDASVLLPLANALGRDSWTSLLLSSGSQAAQQSRRPPLSDEEREKRKAAGLALREQRRAAAPPPTPPPPTISTRALPLAGLDTLLSDYLGPPIGQRSKVLRMCAGQRALQDTDMQLAAAGGGGLTLWADGAACLFINTANSNRRGSYRNIFWREHRGELAGSLCFSWYLGRGQRLTDPSMRALLNPEKPTLLFCRRQPSRPYRCCGRLTAVALANPPDDQLGDGEPAARLPAWETTPPTATHLIWRLDDADALLSSAASRDIGRILPLSEKGMVEELFGATGIGSMRPEQYSQESPAPRG